MALESLVVFPVVHFLGFVFRSLGMSYQEVGIALLGEARQNFVPLRNFAALLGTAAYALHTAGLVVVCRRCATVALCGLRAG